MATMKTDEKEKFILHVTIPINYAQPICLLADKCERAELIVGGEIVAEAVPGEFVQNEYISKYALPFYGGAKFTPAAGTSITLYYDQEDYPANKFPSVTIAL